MARKFIRNQAIIDTLNERYGVDDFRYIGGTKRHFVTDSINMPPISRRNADTIYKLYSTETPVVNRRAYVDELQERLRARIGQPIPPTSLSVEEMRRRIRSLRGDQPPPTIADIQYGKWNVTHFAFENFNRMIMYVHNLPRSHIVWIQVYGLLGEYESERELKEFQRVAVVNQTGTYQFKTVQAATRPQLVDGATVLETAYAMFDEPEWFIVLDRRVGEG